MTNDRFLINWFADDLEFRLCFVLWQKVNERISMKKSNYLLYYSVGVVCGYIVI